MLQWILHLIGSLDYVGVALLMAIENIVLPLPSELIMPLAGFLAARGPMTLFGVTLAGSVGSAIGALPVYAAARALGSERLARWVEQHGRWLMLRGTEVERANQRFARHGAAAVFVSQLLPGIRGLIALPAGVARMNALLFAAANFAGSMIWCAVLAFLGRLLGRHFDRVHEYLAPIAWALLGALAIAAAVWLVRRRRRRQPARAARG